MSQLMPLNAYQSSDFGAYTNWVHCIQIECTEVYIKF